MNKEVQKPWGSYRIINIGKNHLVKEIIVKSGQKLSLQSHNHRSEHWIVVQGVAKVTAIEKEILLRENENIFIPKKSKHRLENNNNEDLIIIEIQYGSDLREDDIIRYDDIYDRI
ncbi:MAG: Alginate biosynthesis protein AlgA [Alphaproteobacteria bacterium MarineAlpha5_Bin9]|nr:MAG: Alginate biosynthesis protein AlgA [Alphaproteobacteria bacterium MarineAlpha5_Bin9]|tara:strand:+ start:4651 stop:4995 length:345 start_codon:yes stop_codon:yes gene_type:complete